MVQSNGTRKSLFPAQTAVPSGSTFDYVSGGANYKITYENLLAGLGVTGTIVQDGDPTGSPVLDDQGSVKAIRNIVGGFGISTAIDGLNSVEISTSFSFDTAGVELVEDVLAAAPAFRSLIAGTGINVSGTDGQIQIALSGTPASTKTVVVSELADFPSPVLNVITLAADTNYLLVDDVDTGVNRINFNGNMISAVEPNLISLTYTGTGNMFTSSGTFDKIEGVRLLCPNGDMFDVDGLGVGIFQLLNVNIGSAQTLGTWNSLLGSQISNIRIEDYTVDGLTFTGAHGVFLGDALLTNANAGVTFDLGTATFDGFALTNCFPTVAAGATFISGSAASANINVGGFGTISNIIKMGAGSSISGISDDDIRWQFSLNSSISDTHPDSLSHNTVGTTVVIPAINTPTIIGGTWTDDSSSQFTVDGAGIVTYNGVKPVHIPITAGMTVRPVSGSNKDFTLYIAINGTPIAASARLGRASSTDRQSVTVVWQQQFNQGDTCSLMIENNTDAIDMVLSNIILRLN